MDKILILQHAVVQMVRIGNKVNWNEPIDMEYVDALNGLRNLLAAQQGVQADECQEPCELGGIHEFAEPVQICSKCGTRRLC